MSRLTFIKMARKKGYERIGLYQCVCGTVKEIRCRSVTTGITQSCGCLNKEIVTQLGRINVTHGLTESQEYMAWTNMKSRCYNPKATQYADYGGRGITVCAEWLNSFETFLADMGRCPVNLTLERIRNHEGYSKANCKWATRSEQAKNQR